MCLQYGTVSGHNFEVGFPPWHVNFVSYVTMCVSSSEALRRLQNAADGHNMDPGTVRNFEKKKDGPRQKKKTESYQVRVKRLRYKSSCPLCSSLSDAEQQYWSSGGEAD